MANLDCPYCLTPQSFNRGEICEACNRKVPRQYIELSRTKPPIWIVTYGLSQHGKSTLLGSTTFLMERLGTVVPRTFHMYLDDFTIRRIADIQRGQHVGKPNLGATALNDNPEPLIIALKNFPNPKESQVFVIFDLAGEVVDQIANRVLDESSTPPAYARAVSKAKTVWFIVSLVDIQKDTIETGKSINNLFWAYQQTMTQLNVPIKDRDILVTYTKADLLLRTDGTNLLEMPPVVYGYFTEDPYFDLGNRGAEKPPSLDVDEYIVELERISDKLREFTQDEVPGGSAFVAMAEDSEVKLYFTINSAQGSPGGTSGAVGTEIKRYRVLDPLLWTITLSHSENSVSAVALVLPTDGSQNVYKMELPLGIYDALRFYNAHPTTYFAGETREAYPTGIAPVDIVPPSGRVPLIGPILDRLPRDSVAVVLTDEVLPMDLDDFADTSWDDRILLISTDSKVMNARIRWKYHAKSVRDLDQISRDFIRYVEALRARAQ